MTNIFRKTILDKFAKQVPELESSLRKAKMKLEPTLQPPFNMLMRSILYQQLAYKAAKTIHDRFLALVGKLTPTNVLSKTQEELRSVGLSRQKASYMHNVAEAFGKGGFLWKYRKIESLSNLSTKEIIDLFIQIKGVGIWTVQMYLIFSLGRLDVLSSGDLGVRKGVMKLYGLDKMPTQKEVDALAEPWHPLETVGTFLAWRVLDET
ncbi:MAG: DNA-3-methyladenine glycosylase 2 family protein [Candidatus Thorarchaeota archaeon]|nr:DNA-3-methyladenine glycosylase 2 family protein [Candidatus Thorarchaeota archaeon]